jgi:hypothetical protein
MLLCGLGGSAQSQVLAAANGTTALPEIEVVKPRAAQPTRRPKTRVTSGKPRATPAASAPVSPAAQLAAKSSVFDQARGNLYTTVGTTSDTISHQTIQDLPQGDNQSVERVLLQAPGVSQDSAASGLLHVRNDHANVQFRINGVMLPDGQLCRDARDHAGLCQGAASCRGLLSRRPVLLHRSLSADHGWNRKSDVRIQCDP